jgi:hypothetical protein
MWLEPTKAAEIDPARDRFANDVVLDKVKRSLRQFVLRNMAAFGRARTALISPTVKAELDPTPDRAGGRHRDGSPGPEMSEVLEGRRAQPDGPARHVLHVLDK